MQKSKTYAPSEKNIQIKWHFIDAENQVLGRLATKISHILIGKNKAQFAPNALINDKVVVTNVEKIRVTGKKTTDKVYQWHTMYPKGLRSTTFGEAFGKDPVKVFMKTVEGMLPKNKLQKHRIADLHAYKGSEHPHKAQEK